MSQGLGAPEQASHGLPAHPHTCLLQVTPWNVERLRQLVVNGPHQHPGALAVEDEKGRVVVLAHLDQQKREALSKQLLADFTGERGPAAAAAPAPVLLVGEKVQPTSYCTCCFMPDRGA